jgi:hypothetical protein
MPNGQIAIGEVQKRQGELCWNLYVELRKELVESQKIRSQIIGVKITSVGAGIVAIAANKDKGVPQQLLVIPAFAAIFFDLLIHSYSFSIHRIGTYCRDHLEKVLKMSYALGPDKLPNQPKGAEFQLWQEFLGTGKYRHSFSRLANLGLTGLAVGIPTISLWTQYSWSYFFTSLSILLLFFYFDIWVAVKVSKTRGVAIEVGDAFRWLMIPIQLAKKLVRSARK